MAKGKPTPEKSKIERDRPLSYSRRQKTADDADSDAPSADRAKAESGEAKPDSPKPDAPNAEAARADSARTEAPKPEAPRTPPTEAKADEAAAIEPPPPRGDPWPDATPQPMKPVGPARARTETVTMPSELMVGGGPPPMPASTPGTVQDPTRMPGPREVPGGNPTDPASPPGLVPSGDSRSLRKGNEFALVYRVQTAVISRFGVVGTRGQWRVVEYPTSSSASTAYAKEVSRFVAEGFSDYRD